MKGINYKNRRPGTGKKWVGIALLIFGAILLSQSLGVFVPDWVLSWPMFLIALGIFTGRRHQFRNPSSYILIIIGAIFLIEEIMPWADFDDFAWPIAIIGLGLYLIIGKKKITNWGKEQADKFADDLTWDKRVNEDNEPIVPPISNSQDDYLDIVSIFGGVKKNIVSKNFQGGEIVAIMGGAEIILTQADITSLRAELEITQVFGGTKLIVPPHWKVTSDLVAIFGGIEDKRPLMATHAIAEEKHLVIKGTSIFGGIDIKSF
ncbi:MAG: LiaF transmembrane domain-containing protein [Sphingobacteriaceae bacterium]